MDNEAAIKLQVALKEFLESVNLKWWHRLVINTALSVVTEILLNRK